MIVSISQSEATRQFVREQEIETNQKQKTKKKGLFTRQHQEEKLLVSDIGPSVLGEQKSLYRRNIETLVWRQIAVAYICFITIIFLFASP